MEPGSHAVMAPARLRPHTPLPSPPLSPLCPPLRPRVEIPAVNILLHLLHPSFSLLKYSKVNHRHYDIEPLKTPLHLYKKQEHIPIEPQCNFH